MSKQFTLVCDACRKEFEHPNRKPLYCQDCRKVVIRRTARDHMRRKRANARRRAV